MSIGLEEIIWHRILRSPVSEETSARIWTQDQTVELRSWYREQEILPLEEGGGARGILITSSVSEQGGIKSDEVAGLIKQVFEHLQ